MKGETTKLFTRLAPLLRPCVFAAHPKAATSLHTLTMSARKPICIDDDDLWALNESFGSEGSSSLHPILISSPQRDVDKSGAPSPLKQSPVKPHNKQFENDFDSDFSDGEGVTSAPVKSDSHTRFSQAIQSFSKVRKDGQSNNHRTLQAAPINTTLPSSSPTKALVEKRLELEQIFADDFESQQSKESQGVQISAPETSSPTYHRIETLYPQIPKAEAPSEENTAGVNLPTLNSKPTLTRADTETLPLESSTQIDTSNFYPTLTKYEKKYGHGSRTEFKESPRLRRENRPKRAPRPIHPPRPPPDMTHWTPAEFNKYRFAGIRPDGTRDISPFQIEKQERLKKEQMAIKAAQVDFEAKNRVKDEKSEKKKIPGTLPNGIWMASDPSFKKRPTSNGSGVTNVLNGLLKRPKVEPQLGLLTQRPALGDVLQTRSMATTAGQPKVVQAYTLSQEQIYIKNLVLDGESLFYTGSAGTGKSLLLRDLIKSLRAEHQGSVAVTASTGLAAVNVGGITLHSFAGIGLGNGPAIDILRKVKRNRKSLARWKAIKVLIIDEVSMISAELFDKLDYIACEIRKNDLPFGGIQVICCGDFFQLPPVSNEFKSAKFCFESDSWKRTMKKTLTLKQVFRQKGDMEFIDMLNDMRKGVVNVDSLRKFHALSRALPKAGVEPTELFSTRAEVERANSFRLKALKSPIHYFEALDGGSITDAEQRARLLSNFMAPEHLELKKGAQVMMIKNIDESLVNGSLGTVIDFVDRDTYLAYENIRDNEMTDDALDNFVGELLKNQGGTEMGSTLNTGKIELQSGMIGGKEAEEREGECLEDTVFDFLRDIKTEDEEVADSIKNKIELMNKLHKSSRGQKLPLVRFLTPSGQSRTIMVNPETWTVDDEKERPLVSRMQLPLMLAWAMSIHKSQGQTIPRVRVNLARVFEKGQAYVAISRAVNREGLQILNFDETKVFAHEKVIEFYSKLQNPSDMMNIKSKVEKMPESEVDQFYSASGSMQDFIEPSPTVSRERPAHSPELFKTKYEAGYEDIGPPPDEEFYDVETHIDPEYLQDLHNAPVPDFDDTSMLIAPPKRRNRRPFEMDVDGSWDNPMSDDSVVSRVIAP